MYGVPRIVARESLRSGMGLGLPRGRDSRLAAVRAVGERAIALRQASDP